MRPAIAAGLKIFTEVMHLHMRPVLPRLTASNPHIRARVRPGRATGRAEFFRSS